MDTHILIYVILGFIGLSLPWIKKFEENYLINVPIIALALGAVIFSLPIDFIEPEPTANTDIILKLSEVAVIISLIGAGLKINRDFSFRAYRVPLLLVVVTMTCCIGATALLGWWFGLVPASALLLGAVFAPTDPVLAGDVQVELDEDEEEEHPVQFSLTAEAGINDGMAFPFTWLAIWFAMYSFNLSEWLNTWLLKDLIYRIFVGIAIGYGCGRAIGWLYFNLPKKINLKPKRLGFLAVAITFLIYGLTEFVSAYGFIAVFVAGLTLRHIEKQHAFHREMHDVVKQVEQFLITVLLLFLGGYLVTFWPQDITWKMVGLCAIFIFIIRPVFGVIATLGTSMPIKHRLAIAFLGIRGIGSVFYLAFALHQTEFAQERVLWSIVALLILSSIVVHRVVAFFFRGVIFSK